MRLTDYRAKDKDILRLLVPHVFHMGGSGERRKGWLAKTRRCPARDFFPCNHF
jgi:hypothetical protein